MEGNGEEEQQQQPIQNTMTNGSTTTTTTTDLQSTTNDNVAPTSTTVNNTSNQQQQDQQQQQQVQQHICKGCSTVFVSRSAVFRHLQQTDAICLSDIDRKQYLQYIHDTNQLKRERILLLYGYCIAPIYENYLQQQTELGKNNDSNAVKEVEVVNNDNGLTLLSSNPKDPIQNGEDVAQLIVQVIEHYSKDSESTITSTLPYSERPLLQRSYGHSRSNHLEQEDGTSAVTEVMMIKVIPLLNNVTIHEWIDQMNVQLTKTLHNIHSSAHIYILGRQLLPMKYKFHPELDMSHRRVEYLLPAEFLLPLQHSSSLLSASASSSLNGILNENVSNQQLLIDLPSFNEESRHRPLNEPLVPTDNDTIMNDTPQPTSTAATLPIIPFQRPSDVLLNLLTRYKKLMKQLTTHVIDLDLADIAAVTEKQFHNQKRRKQQQLHQQQQRLSKKQQRERGNNNKSTIPDSNDAIVNGADAVPKDVVLHSTKNDLQQDDTIHNVADVQESISSKATTTSNDKVLRRKRYHNFTPTVMAHEYLSYRRMDRFYHRATFRTMPHDSSRSTADDKDNVRLQRPYFALSISGDMFLKGQICRVVGLFVALARNIIDEEFVQCVFDEAYPHLIPTPPLPIFGQYATDVYYISIEGKIKSILTPRNIDRYKNGWNDTETIRRVRDWQTKVREYVAQSWTRLGYTTDSVTDGGALFAEQQWTKEILEPWSIRAKEQLLEYRMWKKQKEQLLNHATPLVVEQTNNNATANGIVDNNAMNESTMTKLPIIGVPPNIDPTIPPVYEKVLFYLRKANESGLWPSTTPKRQLVMISNVTATTTTTTGISDNGSSVGDMGATKVTVKPLASSLAMAHSMAKNNKMSKSSAYVFVEGQGGASGSFSLGAMPGDKCLQPKGNTLFPELMEAAFQLEIALCPNRTPSSTIAVNRNAQFRPHTDSGAGAGQSTSLIVGLGTYSGGELMVEGTSIDIRYKPIEFDGWKQRHWTMPFIGERYSLVWFTPKGCEGVNFYQPPGRNDDDKLN